MVGGIFSPDVNESGVGEFTGGPLKGAIHPCIADLQELAIRMTDRSGWASWSYRAYDLESGELLSFCRWDEGGGKGAGKKLLLC